MRTLRVPFDAGAEVWKSEIYRRSQLEKRGILGKGVNFLRISLTSLTYNNEITAELKQLQGFPRNFKR